MIAVTLYHAASLATIHAGAFPQGERWSAASFTGLLATPGTFGLLDERGGFVVVRQAGGEAELLTIAVLPEARRQGIARSLLAVVLVRVPGPVFLEVAADNTAALALYATASFEPCGRRKDYYGPGRDALVLRAQSHKRSCSPCGRG